MSKLCGAWVKQLRQQLGRYGLFLLRILALRAGVGPQLLLVQKPQPSGQTSKAVIRAEISKSHVVLGLCGRLLEAARAGV